MAKKFWDQEVELLDIPKTGTQAKRIIVQDVMKNGQRYANVREVANGRFAGLAIPKEDIEEIVRALQKIQ